MYTLRENLRHKQNKKTKNHAHNRRAQRIEVSSSRTHLGPGCCRKSTSRAVKGVLLLPTLLLPLLLLQGPPAKLSPPGRRGHRGARPIQAGLAIPYVAAGYPFPRPEVVPRRWRRSRCGVLVLAVGAARGAPRRHIAADGAIVSTASGARGDGACAIRPNMPTTAATILVVVLKLLPHGTLLASSDHVRRVLRSNPRRAAVGVVILQLYRPPGCARATAVVPLLGGRFLRRVPEKAGVGRDVVGRAVVEGERHAARRDRSRSFHVASLVELVLMGQGTRATAAAAAADQVVAEGRPPGGGKPRRDGVPALPRCRGRGPAA